MRRWLNILWLSCATCAFAHVPQATYTRGLDLSGTFQGAGGIGGLLARTDHTITNANFATVYYHADGAGNITALVNTNGLIVARYLYDPFGKLVAKSGALADVNRYRFSSKELQPLSGLYYYGFRFYNPSSQRWLNGDPLGEAGGMNLYGFVGNSPLNAVDPMGLKWLIFDWEAIRQLLKSWLLGDDVRSAADPNSLAAQKAAMGLGPTPLRDVHGNLVQPDNLLIDMGATAAANIAMLPMGAGEEGAYIAASKALQAAKGAKVANAASKCEAVGAKALQAAEHGHHSWPKYLGGPFKQALENMPKALHEKYHSGLDKLLPRQIGSEYYRELSPQQQAENFARFLRYTEEFDRAYGTKLVEALTKTAAAIP